MSVRTALLVLMVLMVVRAAVSTEPGMLPYSCNLPQCLAWCQPLYQEEILGYQLSCMGSDCWFNASKLLSTYGKLRPIQPSSCDVSQCWAVCKDLYGHLKIQFLCNSDSCVFNASRINV